MPFDIKQFFRFLVSGYVCLSYFFAFIFASNSFQRFVSGLGLTLDSSFSVLAAGTLAVSVVLGFLIHECDVSFVRYCRRRANSPWMREIIDRDEEPDYTLSDSHLEALLEVSKFGDETERDRHLNKELSNRYSYLYARIEAGFWAPMVALLLFLSSVLLGWSNEPQMLTSFALIFAIVAISSFLLFYCPTLWEEIIAIERLDLLRRRDEVRFLIGR